MTKQDILIFLSDVSNKDIADYVNSVFLEEASDPDVWVVTEQNAQKFKEWLAEKLADPVTDVEMFEDFGASDTSSFFQPDE